MLTDSGGIQEEAPTFGKPVLVLRETTERPGGRSRPGVARLVGTDREPHRRRGRAAAHRPQAATRAMARAVNPYGDGRAAERIARHPGGGALDPVRARARLITARHAGPRSCGYYGDGNAGDEAVLAGMLRGLREGRPDLRFIVPAHSADPERAARERCASSRSFSADRGRTLDRVDAAHALPCLGGGGLLHDDVDSCWETMSTWPAIWG